MRPRAAAAQKLLPGRVRMVAPKTRRGIRANAMVMRVVQAPAFLRVVRFLAGGRGHDDGAGPEPSCPDRSRQAG